jgi:hypothetical protein
MIKYFIIGFNLLSFVVSGQTNVNNNDLYSEILKDNVKNGLVDYKNLKNEKRLDEYINFISKINPSEYKSEKNELAFWINAYNVYTLKIIVDNYPIESINELHKGGKLLSHVFGTTVWDKEIIVINNEKRSLNYIEHDVIRKNFSEPRIHFALVCAAISCPPLRNEAYEGHKLDEQLDDQAKIFLNDETKNKFDIESQQAEISKILDWYEEDFGDEDGEVLIFISRFLQENIAENIVHNPEDWDIDYLDYNWELNEYNE